MKKHVFIHLLLACGCGQKEPNRHVLPSGSNNIRELSPVDDDFNEFFTEFSADSAFQLSRIVFPLKYESSSLRGKEVKTIKKNQYKYDKLEFDGNCQEYSTQLYDSFSLKMRDTGQRVYVREGLNSGLRQLFFFQRFSGKWFMVKIEDLSD